jgi:hypothetical protein
MVVEITASELRSNKLNGFHALFGIVKGSRTYLDHIVDPEG